MIHFIRNSTLGVMALFLSACGATFDTEALRHKSEDGGSFSVELGRAYKKFALAEIDEMADWMGTISYEVLCLISRRVPRVYIKNNQVVCVRGHMGNWDNEGLG